MTDRIEQYTLCHSLNKHTYTVLTQSERGNNDRQNRAVHPLSQPQQTHIHSTDTVRKREQ